MTDTKLAIVETLKLCEAQAGRLLESTYNVMRAIENDGNALALGLFDLHNDVATLRRKFDHLRAMAEIGARR